VDHNLHGINYQNRADMEYLKNRAGYNICQSCWTIVSKRLGNLKSMMCLTNKTLQDSMEAYIVAQCLESLEHKMESHRS